jgi:5-methylcytosine-specific restriction endonuclease McrBC regulatory subunit McrC
MKNNKVVKVKVGSYISLSEISSEVTISDSDEIKFILEKQIKEHYFLYGVEPFKIEYSRASDSYLLRPNSVIGRINCKYFVLEISSKFEEIEIGKWLQLAHYSEASHLVKHANDIIEKNVSENDVLSGIDYFVLSFVSATYDCVNQGLLYDKHIIALEDPHLKGKLNVNRYVQKGGNPFYPQMLQNAKNYNINPNKIIKKALEACVFSSKNSKVRNVANGLLGYFEGVDSEKLINTRINYDFISSLPRLDYEKSLALSKIILEGLNPLEGSNSSFTPFFTINLDVLFEIFVAFELRNMLKDQSYIV